MSCPCEHADQCASKQQLGQPVLCEVVFAWERGPQPRPPRWLESAKAQRGEQVVELLQERGTLSNKQIAESLELGVSSVNIYLKQLTHQVGYVWWNRTRWFFLASGAPDLPCIPEIMSTVADGATIQQIQFATGLRGNVVRPMLVALERSGAIVSDGHTRWRAT